MLQISVIKENPDWVKERLGIRNFMQLELVDEIIKIDAQNRINKQIFEGNKSNINNFSNKIGILKQQIDKDEDEVQKLKLKVEFFKAQQDSLKEEMKESEKKLLATLLQLPNLPSEKVPAGKTPEDNEVIRQIENKLQLPADALPHWELAKKYNLIDFELGTKITGSGFPLYIAQGAKLQRALIQYFLAYNTAAGYKEYLPPFMVNEASAFATGQLPDKEGQMYFVTQDNFYLIPTAEVPVTNIYRDTILKEDDLPVKMTAYSPCFRREAGSYGKDVRGLNRVHQFEKVEIIQIVKPELSYDVLEEMVAHVEKLLQSLELPYRILKLCGGDMGFASALTYDFEVYSAAQKRWLEVSSVTNFESFQTNRLKCRFKDGNGKAQLAHSLNGSSLALPRIMAALLENNQSENGILLPLIMQKYFEEMIIK
ncbi:MAG: serine--tRNA ligase [Parafilimonas sp.]